MVEMKERMRLSGLGHRARAPSHGEAPTTDGAHVVAASMATYWRHNVSQAVSVGFPSTVHRLGLSFRGGLLFCTDDTLSWACHFPAAISAPGLPIVFSHS